LIETLAQHVLECRTYLGAGWLKLIRKDFHVESGNMIPSEFVINKPATLRRRLYWPYWLI